MDNDLLFLGLNLPKEIKDMLKSRENIITKGMTEGELKAYELGVSNSLSALTSLLQTKNENFVINVNIDTPTEFDISDLICFASVRRTTNEMH
jgi:hypothetical protein